MLSNNRFHSGRKNHTCLCKNTNNGKDIMADHNIMAYTEDGVWLQGNVDGYPFWVKVCDEATGFGIDGGRVIKLHIRRKNSSNEIASYERGWDKYPKGAPKGLAQAVIRFCEELPEQYIWRRTFKEERRFLVTEDAVLDYEALK